MDKKGRWYARAGLCITLLLAFLVPFRASAQENAPITVKGRVVDDQSGEPLPGVTVKLKRTNAGVSVNEHGDYSIRANSNDVLVFTYLGFQKREIAVNGRTILNVRLQPSTSALNEVVVLGYGSSTKADLTGSVGQVNVQDMAKAPVASFDQALAGRVAGVQVSSNEGQPGQEGINIVIRGNGSLTQSNAPLYVVDGFPIEDFDRGSINSDDIESINILKDASATAIYGARGANGVVIIETKKGKIGKPQLTYTGSIGFQDVVKKVPVMSPYEFVKYQLERGNEASYIRDGKTLESYKDIKGVDWQDALFRTGRTQIHNLSLRGGTDQTRYSISGSMFGSDAIIINSGYDRYQARVAVDQIISKKMKAGININFSRSSSFGQIASEANIAGSATSYLLYGAWGYRPVTGKIDYSEEDLEENTVDDDIDHLQDYRINPIVSAKNELRKRFVNNLISNAYVTYDITKDLTLKVTGGVNGLLSKSVAFYNSNTAKGTTALPSNVRGQWGSKSYSERNVWSNENTLSYKKKFNNRHSIDVVGGFSWQGTTTEGGGFTSINVPNEQLGINGLDQGTPFSVSSPASVSTLESFLGRVNYSYRSKYLLTASFRSDGSSKFSEGNKWGYFPSGAFAWRMSSEPFMKSLIFIDDAKLRVSYGLTGNNRVGDFSYLATLDPSNSAAYSFGNAVPTQGVIIANLGNANLKWETTEQADIGYDLSLFKRRVELTVDVYRKTTRNLLLNANMPYQTGYASVYKNIGKMRNQGLEITLNTVNVRNKNFSWESNFNISFNQNKILALADGEENILSNVTWETVYNPSLLYIAKVGQPAGQFYGYLWDGVYQTEDFDGNVLKPGIPTNGSATVKPGDIKYRDLNGDGVIDGLDQTVIGRGLPIHSGGFSNNFSYKGINLGVFFQWNYGNDIFNANRLLFEGSTRVSLNQYASYEKRWTPENPSNVYYRVGGQGPSGMYSSRVLEDGSYLRLKTVSLGYDLPRRIVRSLRIASLSVNAAAQNLITWTKYSGMDPEVSSRNSVLTPGFDYSAYPHARTVVFGIKAGF
ncbi:SusC/RagA family TonB-linked outer membrane protein [Chitinophaga lutea]